MRDLCVLLGPAGGLSKQDVREKIWKEENVEIFSLLPLEKFYIEKGKADKSKEKEEEKHRWWLIPHTFSNWLQAFAILASVIGEKAPEIRRGLRVSPFLGGSAVWVPLDSRPPIKEMLVGSSKRGSCRFGTACRFCHECSGCGGSHSYAKCFKEGKSQPGESV